MTRLKLTDNDSENVLKVTSKMLYNGLKHKKQTVPSAQKKIKLKYPDLSLEWKEIYSLPFTVTQDTNTTGVSGYIVK